MDERDTGSDATGDEIHSHDEPPAAPVAPRKRKRHWGLLLFGVFILLPIVAFIAWTAVALNWSYAVEQRAGYIQKFSEKGWLCKTWEGELAMANPLPGAMPEKFEIKKFDPVVRKHVVFKEAKIK